MQAPAESQTVPLLGLAQAGAGGYFDNAGFPAGQGWDAITLPSSGDGSYALEVHGDSMEPLYREGDKVIVSASEQVRKGDRVAVGTRAGEVMVKVLHRQTVSRIEPAFDQPGYPPRLLEVQGTWNGFAVSSGPASRRDAARCGGTWLAAPAVVESGPRILPAAIWIRA